MHLIQLQNIGKVLNGVSVLEDINLTFSNDHVYGLVGKNGSGKTMLLRILSGLIRPTTGTILYDQKELYKDIKNVPDVGVVIENSGLYPEFTGFQNLLILAEIQKKIKKEDIYTALERVGLSPADKRAYKKYSLGMKQRIAIAQAIMEKPDYIFLDEPTNALDTDGVSLIRQIVKEETERGALVIMTSHNSEDINLLCSKIINLAEGKVSRT